MTLVELLTKYNNNNPHWRNRGANLTPNGLIKLIETTYDVGYKAGVCDQKKELDQDLPDIFDEIFG